MSNSLRPMVAAGAALGVGMGGFADGILFHQLLQVHNMLSAKYPPTTVVNLEINMFWDGLFHVFCWLMTALGLALLWNSAQQRDVALPTKVFVGSLSLGWGLFNLVEGVINHHFLHIHHVRETADHLTWDFAFLASGVVLIIVGFVLIRSNKTSAIAT
jgi:uncharacterized membrane protein